MTPELCLAVRVDDRLVGVFPCVDADGGRWSIDDALAALESDTFLETFSLPSTVPPSGTPFED